MGLSLSAPQPGVSRVSPVSLSGLSSSGRPQLPRHGLRQADHHTNALTLTITITITLTLTLTLTITITLTLTLTLTITITITLILTLTIMGSINISSPRVALAKNVRDCDGVMICQ